MSYEPMLLIRAEDLRNLEGLMYDRTFAASPTCNASPFLMDVVCLPTVEFEDSEFFICRPELSSFNSEVREFLDDFDVYYRTWI